MGELSRIFGSGSKLEIAGKVYKLSPWTFGIQAEFENYLEGEAWKTCQRAKQHLTEEEVSDLRAKTRHQITTGLYSGGSAGWIDALRNRKHAPLFLYLLIEGNDPSITMAIINTFFEEHGQEAFDAIAEAGSDPSQKTRPPPEKEVAL